MTEDEEYQCENCKFFNEEEIPADCQKGHGKIAFRRPICSDFKIKNDGRGRDK